MTHFLLSLVPVCIALLCLITVEWLAWRARQKRRDDDCLIGKTTIFNGQPGTITKYDGS